jgi:hypothetical protein
VLASGSTFLFGGLDELLGVNFDSI